MSGARFLSFFVYVFGLLAAPACSEPLNLVGTGDGLEIFRELAKSYAVTAQGRTVLVPPSIGSGGAIVAVGAGRERIGRIARALTSVEQASGLVAYPVFQVPSAFYVHPSVGSRALSAAQLADIFAGRVTNWSQVGGPDLKMRVVRREESDSTVLVLRAGLPEFRDLVMTERSKMALTTQEAISSVRDNEGAIGFGSYTPEVAAMLGVITLDGRVPTAADYPLTVKLAVIWHEVRRDADIDHFVAYLATPEARRIMSALGAVALVK